MKKGGEKVVGGETNHYGSKPVLMPYDLARSYCGKSFVLFFRLVVAREKCERAQKKHYAHTYKNYIFHGLFSVLFKIECEGNEYGI